MQGSLSEFRLAEILQLVAVQQKTGLLRLTRGQQIQRVLQRGEPLLRHLRLAVSTPFEARPSLLRTTAP